MNPAPNAAAGPWPSVFYAPAREASLASSFFDMALAPPPQLVGAGVIAVAAAMAAALALRLRYRSRKSAGPAHKSRAPTPGRRRVAPAARLTETSAAGEKTPMALIISTPMPGGLVMRRIIEAGTLTAAGEPARLGWRQSADIAVEDDRLDDWHAEFFIEDGAFVVRNAGSNPEKAALSLNGAAIAPGAARRLPESGELNANGLKIRFCLQVREDEADIEVESEVAADALDELAGVID